MCSCVHLCFPQRNNISTLNNKELQRFNKLPYKLSKRGIKQILPVIHNVLNISIYSVLL